MLYSGQFYARNKGNAAENLWSWWISYKWWSGLLLHVLYHCVCIGMCSSFSGPVLKAFQSAVSGKFKWLFISGRKYSILIIILIYINRKNTVVLLQKELKIPFYLIAIHFLFWFFKNTLFMENVSEKMILGMLFFVCCDVRQEHTTQHFFSLEDYINLFWQRFQPI